MSQRECAGFNWPPLSIPAEQPVSISPVTVSRAGPFARVTAVGRLIPPLPRACLLASVSLLDVESLAAVVGHPAASATRSSDTCFFRPSGVRPVILVPSGQVCPPLGVVGLGQPACQTTRPSKEFSGTATFGLPPSFQSRVVGVGHGAPVEALPDVGRAEARSAGICRPCGVARRFQVSLYKVEPSEAVLARNLLSKNDVRSALLNEPVEGWPEVPLVSKPAAFACRAERLARAGAGPDWLVVSPSGASQGVGPDADPGEEVDLDELPQVFRVKVFDAPLVHNAGGDMPLLDQLAQPRGGLRVNLVIQRGHRVPFSRPPLCPASAALSTAPCA